MEYDPAAPYYHFTYEPAASVDAAERVGGEASSLDFRHWPEDQQAVSTDAPYYFNEHSAGGSQLGGAFPVGEPWLPIEDVSHGPQRPSILGGIPGPMLWDVVWSAEPPSTHETRPWQPYLPHTSLELPAQTSFELPYPSSTVPMAEPYQPGSALYTDWEPLRTALPPALPSPPVSVPSQMPLPALTIPPYDDDGPPTASSQSTDVDRTPEGDVESDPEYHATPTKRRRPPRKAAQVTKAAKARSAATKAPRKLRRKPSQPLAVLACEFCRGRHIKCERPEPNATRCVECIGRDQACKWPERSYRGRRDLRARPSGSAASI